ncbi:MAG: 5-guanidino-2-oxopentanoate decarboxylase [Pseudomonadota bacterium]
MIPVADAALQYLQRRGIDTVFGIPGIHTLELYRGLARSRLRHVLARHETGACFMADGFARVSGRPAVVLVITGPGLTNAATGIGQAYSDSIPMLVLTTVRDRCDLGHERGRLHEIRDQRRMIEPLTALSRTVWSADEVQNVLQAAFEAMLGGRPRPAVIEFPLDVLRELTLEVEDFAERIPPQPTQSTFSRAVELIDAARSVVVVSGGGAARASESVFAFVEKVGATLVTTVNGRGVIPESHPQSLGTTLRLSGTKRLLAHADLVVAVGTELAETDSWSSEIAIGGQLIRIDIDRDTLQRNRHADVALLGDAGTILCRLTEQVRPRRFKPESLGHAREENRQAWTPMQLRHRRVLEGLRGALARDSIIAVDSTEIGYSANLHAWIDKPCSYLHGNGFGSLGYALPAAIGGKLAAPERDALAIVGDGGIQFTLQELATAVSEKLPIPILIWDNDGFGAIAEAMRVEGIPEIGVRLRNPDFVALARAYGCAACVPGSIDEIAEALRMAFRRDHPTVIHLREDAAFLA